MSDYTPEQVEEYAKYLRTVNAAPELLEYIDAFAATLRQQGGRADGGLAEALKSLDRAYVSLLEAGRDRICELGGTCDPVDVMERSDPHLTQARRALQATLAQNTQGEAVASVTTGVPNKLPQSLGDHAMQTLAGVYTRAERATVPFVISSWRIVAEAAEVLQMVLDSGVTLPPNWRWPLLDELSGIAAQMQNAAAPSQPKDAGEADHG